MTRDRRRASRHSVRSASPRTLRKCKQVSEVAHSHRSNRRGEVFFSQSVPSPTEDVLQRAQWLARSARARRHGDLDFTDRPYLHHETWWGCVVSRVRCSNWHAGIADVGGAGQRETRTDDADPRANQGRRPRRSQRLGTRNQRGAYRRGSGPRGGADRGLPRPAALLNGLSVGEFAERVVRAGTVNGGRSAVHEEGDTDGFGRLLLCGSRPNRPLSV